MDWPHARRYYLNGVDAYRLKLLLPLTEAQEALLLLKQEAGEGGMGRSLDAVSTQELQPCEVL